MQVATYCLALLRYAAKGWVGHVTLILALAPLIFAVIFKVWPSKGDLSTLEDPALYLALLWFFVMVAVAGFQVWRDAVGRAAPSTNASAIFMRDVSGGQFYLGSAGVGSEPQDLLTTSLQSEDHRPWLALGEMHRDSFKGVQLRLTDLIPRGSREVIAGKTFVDCHLHGPAIVFSLSSEFRGTRFDVRDTVESVLFELTPERTSMPAIGPVALVYCKIIDCIISGVGFVGPEDAMNALRKGIPMAGQSSNPAISSQDQT